VSGPGWRPARRVALRLPDKIAFLQEDFYDSLRWLFVGALAWEAASRNQQTKHQRVLGMFTAAVQARALYEFFYGRPGGDNARAKDFAPSWAPNETHLYRTYMASHKPANKRMFHLVYGRAGHSGGTGTDGPDHLKNQILGFATDVVTLSRDFIGCAEPAFRPYVEEALRNALSEADQAAIAYGLNNPLT
jgi:hypothetical protein